MTIGLIRSETAGDPRTLTAAGASARSRRNITGATAGALGVLGALLGTAVAALAGAAWARSSLSTTFGHIPVRDILIILVACPWWPPSARRTTEMVSMAAAFCR